MRFLLSCLFAALVLSFYAGGAAAQSYCSGLIRIGAISTDTISAVGNGATGYCFSYGTSSPVVPDDGVVIQSRFDPSATSFSVTVQPRVSGALSLALSYDGLGTPDYRAIGVNAGLNLPF